MTSALTITEVLVKPMKMGNVNLAREYKEILLGSETLEVIGVNAEIAEQAAILRSRYNIITPDAIHLATSLYSNAHCFITNDRKLKSVKEIEVLCVEEFL